MKNTAPENKLDARRFVDMVEQWLIEKNWL